MHILNTIFAIIILLPILYGCGNSTSAVNNVAAIEKCDSLPKPVKQLVKAVADNDSAKFAELIDYPLQRPYPLPDIDTPREMMHYYEILVDDSLHNTIINAPVGAWEEYGWRGWSLFDGQYLWIDENIYNVNYVSQRESAMRDSLINLDINSIAPQLRNGWTPIACLKGINNGTIYRIDSSKNESTPANRAFRLCCYNKGTDLHSMPNQIYYGSKKVEGSAAYTYYSFNGHAGMTILYSPDNPTDEAPAIIFTDPDGKSHSVEVEDSYWLKLIK